MTTIETIVGVGIILGVGYILVKMFTKKESAQEAVKEAFAEAKSVADVNGDGKVNVADAVEAVKKTKAATKKVAAKAKETTKAATKVVAKKATKAKK